MIKIGGREFSSKAAAKRHFRTIRERYSDNERVSDDDAALLHELLSSHPDAVQKVGAGVDHFTVAPQAPFGTRCFVLHRQDGTSTEWSADSCIDGGDERRDRLAALRVAIAPQIVDFKRREFDGRRSVTCVVTGSQTEFGEADVDHIPPDTFAALVTAWLESENMSLEDVEITPPRDAQPQPAITNNKQRESWGEFHRRHSRLRITSRAANRGVVRREGGT